MDKFVNLAEKGKIDELELEWMEAAEKADTHWPDMLIAAKLIAKKHSTETAESLISYLLAALEGAGKCYEAVKASEQSCNFLPESSMLRKEYIHLYESYYNKEPWCEQILDASLKNSSLPLEEAAELLKYLMQMLPGTYVRKDPGARIGMVEEIVASEGLKVNIEGKSSVLPFDNLSQIHKIDQRDIRALVFFDKETLRNLAEKDPVELVRVVLKTFEGRTDQNQIKRYLLKIIGEKQWKSWWSKTSKKLEKAPDIGIAAGRKKQFFIRSNPISHAEELKSKFNTANAEERLQMLSNIARELDATKDKEKPVISYMAQQLLDSSHANSKDKPELAVNSLAILWKLGDKIEPMSEELQCRPGWLEDVDWLQLLKFKLVDSEYLEFVVRYLPQWAPDNWEDIFMQTLPYLPEKSCDIAANHLLKDQEDALNCRANLIDTILARPDACLTSLLWIWKKYREAIRKQEEWAGPEGMVIMRRVLSAASSASRNRAGESKSTNAALDSLKEAFAKSGEVAVESAAQSAKDDEILALVHLIERNPGLNNLTRKIMTRAVRAARPELFRISTQPWESNDIFTTRQGLRKRRSVYDELINEKIPQIVKQVGEAAAFGDLSENAEYTAALEERERLSRKAADIKKELNRARIIPPDMPGTEHVTIGCKVKALNSSGKAQTLTFLGPWDADPTAGIYSYNSPLALAFMGAKAGEEVKCETEDGMRQWEIIEIEPAGDFLS